MITITRKESTVKITVAGSIPWEFGFEKNMNSEPYATYLQQDLSSKLFKELQRIRQEAYDKGYSDKTRRNVKREWMPGHFDSKL